MIIKLNSKKLYIIILDLCIINAWLAEFTLISNFYINIKNIILGLIIIGIILEIFLSKFKLSQLIATSSILILTFYSYMLTNVTWIFYLFFAILFAWKIDDIGKYIKHIYIIYASILVINITTFLLQYILARETLTVVTTRNILRYTINFSNAGNASKFFVFFAMLILLKNKKFTKKNIIALIIGSIFFYYFTRSDIVIFVPLLILVDYFKNNYSFKRLVSFFSKWLLVILTLFTVITLPLSNNILVRFIDNYFLTGRINMSVKAYQLYSFTLLGQNINNGSWLINNDNLYHFLYIDNSIFLFIINYGVVYIGLIIIIILLGSKYLNYFEQVSIILFIILGFLVSSMISPLGTFPLVILSNHLWKNRVRKVIKNDNVKYRSEYQKI